MQKTRATRVRLLLAWGLLGSLALTSCGGDEFEREPRPPVPLDTTAVITEREVEVSPNEFGGGPILLTISNQTPEAHSVSIRDEDGGVDDVLERTGPINPSDTATIQQDLDPGRYVVVAESEGESSERIDPGVLDVGPTRPSASDELELP